MTVTISTPSAGTKARMPAWFLPHGAGPCFFMDWQPAHAWDRMAGFLKGAAATLPRRPHAIVVVSAHWLTSAFEVTSGDQPELIYDYFGFPPNTYTLHYPAPGDPAVAARIAALLAGAQLPAHTSPKRGFDHGVFIPLLLVFPGAEIPVVQLSLQQHLDPRLHLAVGRALEPLRDDGILIIGSGMSFHNMRGYGDPRYGPIADAFDHWLVQAVTAAPEEREKLLANWEQAPSARLSHPRGAEEHLLPLMVVAGAAGRDQGKQVFSDRVMETRLSAFAFG